jgi:hypothetical protein
VFTDDSRYVQVASRLKRAPTSFQDGFPGEVPAVLRSTTRQGPLFLALMASFLFFPAEIVAIIVLRSDILVSILSTLFVFLFFYLIYQIWDRQSKAGPIMAWFSPRTEHAWVKVDEEDFVVRLPGKRVAFKPSKLEWVDDTSFNLWEEEMSLQLVFASQADALQVATMIKTKFPQSLTTIVRSF